MAEDRFIVKICGMEIPVVVESNPWIGNPTAQNAYMEFGGFPVVSRRAIISEDQDYREIFSGMALECFFYARSTYRMMNR